MPEKEQELVQFIELLKNNIQLKKFLPTSEEVEKMNEIEFADWIEVAMTEIPKRRMARDPLFHLKKQISRILEDESKSEIEKEDAIYNHIKYYKKFIRHQLQSEKSI
jgi:hypothetical protein